MRVGFCTCTEIVFQLDFLCWGVTCFPKTLESYFSVCPSWHLLSTLCIGLGLDSEYDSKSTCGLDHCDTVLSFMCQFDHCTSGRPFSTQHRAQSAPVDMAHWVMWKIRALSCFEGNAHQPSIASALRWDLRNVCSPMAPEHPIS